jgi:hypothetical protein
MVLVIDSEMFHVCVALDLSLIRVGAGDSPLKTICHMLDYDTDA